MKHVANLDERGAAVYQIACAIYAETGATSLRLVEAVASTVANIAKRYGRDYLSIVSDNDIFSSCADVAPENSRRFNMCLRVVRRMMRGGLGDSVYGAVRFHRANELPSWAISRGYIADVDGMLFYR